MELKHQDSPWLVPKTDDISTGHAISPSFLHPSTALPRTTNKHIVSCTTTPPLFAPRKPTKLAKRTVVQPAPTAKTISHCMTIKPISTDHTQPAYYLSHQCNHRKRDTTIFDKSSLPGFLDFCVTFAKRRAPTAFPYPSRGRFHNSISCLTRLVRRTCLSGCTVGQIDRETGTRNMLAVRYDERRAGAGRGLIEHHGA
jgi:hypothetical protein